MTTPRRTRHLRTPHRAVLDRLETRLLLSTVIQTYTLTAAAADNGVLSNATVDLSTLDSLRLGDSRTPGAAEALVFPFALPTLPAGATITSAQLTVFLEQVSRRSLLLGSVDLYGLPYSTSATVYAGDFYQGDYDGGGNAALQTGVLTASSGRGAMVTSVAGGTNLASYLTAQYTAGAQPGNYVFLRLNTEVTEPAGAFWLLATADSTDPTRCPTLTLTVTLPDPNTPVNFTVATTSNTTLALSWQENVAGVTSYTLQRSTDGTHFSTIGSSSTSAFTDSGLTANTKYYYQVAAIEADQSTSPYSTTASNTTIPTFTQTRWVLAGAPAGGTGTYTHPYNTIAAALSGLPAGGGVVVRGGTYYESNLQPPSGTPGNPTTLMAAPGERAIISGFQTISGWTACTGASSNIYLTTLNWNPDTLYVDETAEGMARSPDQGWWTAPLVTQNTSAGYTTITDPADLTGVGNLIGGYVQAHTAYGNVYDSSQITAQNTTSGTITFTSTATLATLANGDYYTVKDLPALITQPGEWAVVQVGTTSSYTMYFEPTSPADLALTQAQHATTSGIEFNRYPTGTQNVIVRGLEVTGHQGSGIDVVGSNTYCNNITIDGNIVDNNGGDGIFVRYANNITVTHNIVMANANGIGTSSTQDVLIDSNEVAYNWTDGIDATGDIHGTQPTQSGFAPSFDVTISNNYIHSQLGYGHCDGIQMYRWISRVNVLNNVILDNGQGMMMEEVDDTGTGPDGNWSTMSNNVIYDTGAYTVIFGHSNTYDWVVNNNTIGNAGYGPYSMTATNYSMTGNITIGAAGISWNTTTHTNIANYTGDDNYYYAPASTYVLVTSTPWTSYASVAAFTAATGQDVHSASSTTIGAVKFMNAPLLGSMVTNILKCTANSLYLNSTAGFAVGDHIEINADGVVRTITNVSGNIITFDVPLPAIPLTGGVVDDWKTNTNYALDLRLQSSSPAATMSAAGGSIGANLNVQNYVNSDFNGDGIRDLPTLPADVKAGLPNPDVWIPPSF